MTLDFLLCEAIEPIPSVLVPPTSHGGICWQEVIEVDIAATPELEPLPHSRTPVQSLICGGHGLGSVRRSGLAINH